jgi:hypothetical protein
MRWVHRGGVGASLAMNALAGSAVIVYLRRHGVRAGSRSMAIRLGLTPGSRPDYPNLARHRFGGLPGAEIVFFGDSHIQDGPLSEIAGCCAMRGIGGQTIADAETWVDQALYPQTRRLVIEIGTNDAIAHRTAQQERSDYAALLDRIKRLRSDVKIVMLTVPGPHRLARETKQVNTALREAAAVAGIQVIDIAAVLDDDGEIAGRYSLDGIHINGTGYAAIGILLREAAGIVAVDGSEP